MTRIATLIASLFLCTGCFDFVEPDLPEAGAPAILEAAIHIGISNDIHFTGVLAPALTIDGLARTIRNDTIRVLGVSVGADTVLPNRSHVYDFRTTLADVNSRPITLEAPDIEEVIANPPVIRWENVRRLGSDTIVWQPATDLVLRIARTESSEPAPQGKQWSVDLTSAQGNFRIGSNGSPPDSIRIPAYYVPASVTGQVSAVLTFFQNGTFRVPPGDYLLNLTTDTRVRWTILVTPQR